MKAKATVEPPTKSFWRSIDRWWFGYGSPVSLGVFRLVIGFLIFVNQVMIGIDFEAWFTERGFVPAEMGAFYLGQEPRLNLLAGVTSTPITLAFYILVTLAALTTCLGLWTRVSTIVLALGLITLHHRNAMILHGGDLVMRFGAIYLALAPSGGSCSLDRLIGLWKGKAPAVVAAVSLWPQRLLQFQVALIYFTTVWHKWFGTYWRDGTATWYPLHLKEFERFWLPDFMREWLPFITVTTYGTLVVELALATLVFFKPWRKWALLGGIGLHMFIEYAMNIPLFAFLMISTYIAFYEGDEVTAWAKRVGERLSRFRATIRLPKGRTFREGPGRAIRATDAFGWLAYEPGEADVWEAMDAAGRPRAPFRLSLSRSVGAWPAALIPGLWRRLLDKASIPAAKSDQSPEAQVAHNTKAR